MSISRDSLNRTHDAEGIVVFRAKTYHIRTRKYMLVTDTVRWAHRLIDVLQEDYQACLDIGATDSASSFADTIAVIESWLLDFKVRDEKAFWPYLQFVARQKVTPLCVTKTNIDAYVTKLMTASEVHHTQPDGFMPCFYFDCDRLVLIGTEEVRVPLRGVSNDIQGFRLTDFSLGTMLSR